MPNTDLEKPTPAKVARSRTVTSQTTGACIYMAGSRAKCELLTKPECEQLAGIWLPERDCSKILKMELREGAASRARRTSSRLGT
jgi:hypothetical protein